MAKMKKQSQCLRLSSILIAILVFIMLVPASIAKADDGASGQGSFTTPLTISDVSASNIGYHGTTISWKTNGDATSQVFYDTASHDNTADYAYHTVEDTDLVSEHSVRLTGLSSGRTYHYRVRSATVINGSDFIAISEDYTFRTLSPAPPPPPPTIETNLLGIEESFPISRSGEILETIEAASEDGILTITLPKGTIVLLEGEPLETLEVAVDETPPDPPEDAHLIGLAYDFGPDGATFDPPLTLEYTYDPDALAEGVAEEDLVLAYYDEEAGEWVELDCVVDTENNIIIASVPHFTTFAIIGVVTPLPPVIPATFSVGSLSIFPSIVDVDETVTISVLVANTGGKSGSCKVTLKINGVEEAAKEVTVRAGLSKEVTFSVTKEEAGSYTVAVDGLSGSFTVAPVVVPPEPAAFSVSNLSVTPLEVEPGDTVTITVSVANTGGESGSCRVTLKINGVVEATKEVVLAPGASESITFTTSKDVAGTYSVDVNGLIGSFTVKEKVVPPILKPINWPLIGGIIGGVMAAGLLVYFLVIRRRRAARKQ